MQLSYELIQKDFLESLKAHRHRTASRRWFFRIFAILLLLCFGLGLALWSRPGNLTAWRAVLLIGLPILCPALVWGIQWRSARNQFSRQPSAQGRLKLRLDDRGAHFRADTGSSDVEWSGFTGWLESKNQFLLYTSPLNFAIVPKREMTPDQISGFRALLTERIVKRETAAPRA